MESLVDRFLIMIMHFKIKASKFGVQSLSKFTYSFYCVFVRLIYLTVKTFRRLTDFCSAPKVGTLGEISILYVLYKTMQSFLVGAKLPRPCLRSLPASLQVTEPDKHTLKRVNAMDGVYLAFAGAKSYQLRIPR